jgi:TonB family protein
MKRNEPLTDPGQQHLPLAMLRRYQQGLLPAPEEHQVERHLLDCDLCADILAGMEEQSASQTAAAAQAIHERVATALQKERRKVVPLFSRERLAVAATLVLLLCAAGLVLFYNLEQVKQSGEVPVARRETSIRSQHQQAAAPPAAILPAPAAPIVAPAAPVPPSGPVRGSAIADRQGKALLAAASPAVEPSGRGANQHLAQALAEDIVVEVLPLQPPVAMRPDSGAFKTESLAAAPALAGKAAGFSDKVAGRRVARQQMAAVPPAAYDGKTISGRVLDAEGRPLPGVSVLLKGTAVGTATDPAGRYSLPVPPALEEVTLTYNFIGYALLEKRVDTKALAAVDAILEPDNKALSEVVVMGVGKESTGAGTEATADASPVGGWGSFKKYLRGNLKQPVEAGGHKVSGRVVVGFTVSAQGTLTDVRVIKSLSGAADAEALRLVQQGPGWQPAKAGSQALPQSLRVSIRFPGKE